MFVFSVVTFHLHYGWFHKKIRCALLLWLVGKFSWNLPEELGSAQGRSVCSTLRGGADPRPEPRLFRKTIEESSPVALCKQSMNWSAPDKVVSRSEGRCSQVSLGADSQLHRLLRNGSGLYLSMSFKTVVSVICWFELLLKQMKFKEIKRFSGKIRVSNYFNVLLIDYLKYTPCSTLHLLSVNL